MSFVYTSNSPEYLNYIAHTKTRNDILNDPRLCILLEDPHIKDNMELALLYRAAQYGDYEAKKEFIGFFLANGPELDTDTIMYFREKILHNKTYTNIYHSEFKDIAIVDNLRINTYLKDTTDTNDALNCLSNPCDYLGPFSSSIGLMGDDRNFNNLGNLFSRLNGENEEGESDENARLWGNIPSHMFSKLIPNLSKAYSTMMAGMAASASDFSKKLKNAGLSKDATTAGDPKAENMAKDISSAIKVNIVSNLGDCSRIWENMRRLRAYDPAANAKKPFEAVSKKTVDGNPAPNYTPRTDVELKAKPITVQDAPSGTSNRRADASSNDINTLETRYKDTYSYYKYLIENHHSKLDVSDLHIMEDFIKAMDKYLKGEAEELPRSAGLSKSYKDLEKGWSRGYKGIIKEKDESLVTVRDRKGNISDNWG